MNWRRVGAVLLAFVALFEVVVRLASPGLPEPVRWSNAWQEAKFDALTDRSQVDLVVLGSSIANQSVEATTVIANIDQLSSGFNAALPGASISLMSEWSTEVVLPLSCPKVIVVAIAPRDVNDAATALQADLDQYRSSSGRQRWLGIGGVSARIDRGLVDVSALVRYGPVFRQPVDLVRYAAGDAPTPWDRPVLTDSGRGTLYDDRTFTTSPTRQQLLREDGLANFAVGGQEMQALESTFQLARSVEATPVVVLLPVYEVALAELLPASERDLQRAWAEIGLTAEQAGVDVIDLRHFNDRGLFADEYHANADGSAAVSEALAIELNKLLAGQIIEPTCRQAER